MAETYDATKLCGDTRDNLTCDRERGHSGDHRGYYHEERDTPMFWSADRAADRLRRGVPPPPPRAVFDDDARTETCEPGDLIRFSTALLRQIYEQPDHVSALVKVVEVRVESDGAKTLVLAFTRKRG